MPITPQTLNITNLRSTSGKSTNLHTIRKLIKYSLKNVNIYSYRNDNVCSTQGNVYFYRFQDIAIRR